MYVHRSRMHTEFCRNTRRSNVLSNLGANRSCDLKNYIYRPLILSSSFSCVAPCILNYATTLPFAIIKIISRCFLYNFTSFTRILAPYAPPLLALLRRTRLILSRVYDRLSSIISLVFKREYYLLLKYFFLYLIAYQIEKR